MDSGLIHVPYMRPGRTAKQTFDWALQVAIEADRAGFTEMMVAEHPELVIGAAALQTERIKFAPMAHLLPYHNPASLAIQTGWLSQILEGRYFLGIGAGAYPSDGILRGLTDLSENHLMVREAMEIMERVWKREPFHFEGQFFKGGYPEEQPHDPSSGDEQHLLADYSPWGGKMDVAVTGLSHNSPSMKFAGERGYIPVSVFSGSSVLKTHWDTYEAAALANGHAADRSRYHVSQDVFVADTDAEAKKRSMEGPMGYAWEHYLLPVFKRFNQLEGFLADAGGAHESEVDLEWIAEHIWIVGSPETVIKKLERLFEITGGWGTLQVQTHDYLDDPQPWFESMHLIANEVAPKLQIPGAAPTPASTSRV